MFLASVIPLVLWTNEEEDVQDPSITHWINFSPSLKMLRITGFFFCWLVNVLHLHLRMNQQKHLSQEERYIIFVLFLMRRSQAKHFLSVLKRVCDAEAPSAVCAYLINVDCKYRTISNKSLQWRKTQSWLRSCCLSLHVKFPVIGVFMTMEKGGSGSALAPLRTERKFQGIFFNQTQTWAQPWT